MMERFSAKPTASIPQACDSWSETCAAYRFLGNADVTSEGILVPHWSRTQERMSGHRVVLCIQDTTELDFSGQETEGLGPLNYEARGGMYLHPTYAVTPEREPLGLLDAYMWAPEERGADGVPPGQNESARWPEGYERLAEMAPELPDTRLADGGGDDKLWAYTTKGEAIGEITFRMGPRDDQKARAVRQQVWSRGVEISDGKGGRITATCIVAREIDAPKGVKPVEWRLLTNRQASTVEQAVELIEWYRARW